MASVAFDTLKAFRELQQAGFNEAQAEAVVSTMETAMEGNLATKADLLNLATKDDIADVRQEVAEVKQEVAEVKQDLAVAKQEMATKQDLAGVRQEVAEVKQDLASRKWPPSRIWQ